MAGPLLTLDVAHKAFIDALENCKGMDLNDKGIQQRICNLFEIKIKHRTGTVTKAKLYWDSDTREIKLYIRSRLFNTSITHKFETI